MATYDYFCPNCNFEKEVEHGMFEEVEILCDLCNTKMKKAFTNITYHLKGNGWVSKGNNTTGSTKKTKEVGFGIKQGMEDALDDKIKKVAKRK